MNTKHEWINTFFIAFTLAVCLFIIVDIAYNERIWEFNTLSLKIRISALGVTFASFYFGSYIYRRISLSFIQKSKDKKRTNWKEFIFVLLINFIILNILHSFIMFFITEMGFRWRESLLINTTGSILLFLFYLMVRNGILSKNYIEQSLQLEKIKVNQLEAELKFLKSQYHPHFLFNALNTIYFQLDEKNNKEAKHSIEQLSDLLRYQLYDINQEVTIDQEINYLKSYIAFQQLRTSERLVLDLYFDPDLKEQKIHPLLFQPLIENAFKHVRGEYRISLEMRLKGNQIQSEIKNSISQSQNISNKKNEGIGLENLKRRLDLLYTNKYNLEIRHTESMFVVRLNLNIN